MINCKELTDQEIAEEGFKNMLIKYKGTPSRLWINNTHKSYRDYGVNTSPMEQLANKFKLKEESK